MTRPSVFLIMQALLACALHPTVGILTTRSTSPQMSESRRSFVGTLASALTAAPLAATANGMPASTLLRATPEHLAYHAEDATRLTALLQAAVPQQPGARMLKLLQRPTEIDVTISGGGLKGYYLLGARHVIASRPELVVKRYSGTSAGAWTAMFMATELSSADWLATYTLTAEAARRAVEEGKSAPLLMEAYREEVWPWLKTVLPPDAHARCSGRLHVTVTSMEKLRPTPMVISKFESNEELFEACVASSCVPLITQRGMGTRYQDRHCFDGLFSGESIPTFDDEIRPQLVFNLMRIPYSRAAMVRAVDPSIEGLVVSGALQTARFLDGRRGDPRFEVVSWQSATSAPARPGGALPSSDEVEQDMDVDEPWVEQVDEVVPSADERSWDGNWV